MGSFFEPFSQGEAYFMPDGALELAIVFVWSPKKELLA